MMIHPLADLTKISDVSKRYIAQKQTILKNTEDDARLNRLTEAVVKRIAFMVDTSQAEGNILKLKKMIDSLGD